VQCEARAQLLMLADLVNCRVVSYHSCLNLLRELANVLHEPGVLQARADAYVHCVLRCLPYVGAELHQRSAAGLADLLGPVEAYLK